MKAFVKPAFALALFPVLFLSCALSEGASLLTARGTASVAAEPDRVTLTCSCEARDTDLAAAREKVAETVSAATEAFLSLGIEQEEIATAWYSVYPYYEEDGEGKTREAGYEVNHALSVGCRDLSKLDEVIAGAGAAGMTGISGITFDVTDRHGIYLTALKLAVQAAREKAEALASAAGLSLIGVVSLEEEPGADSVSYAAAEDAASARFRAGGSGIAADSVNVTASVTAVFSAE